MSTEQKPETQVVHHKEPIETTALGETLVTGWQKFKAGQLISYKWMGIILIAVAAIGLTWYILAQQAGDRSKLWVELEGANSLTALEKFAEANPNSMPGNVAEMDRARFLIGPDGIEKLPTAKDETERKRAIENIDTARDLMTKLIDKFKDQPILKLECFVGMAKSEAALIGINKDGSLTEFRGSVEKLIEWLDKIGEAADGTPWGDDAKKLSSSLKSGSKVKDELVNVQRSLYTLAPTFQGGDPIAPGGRLPTLPGLPGGGPIVPPIAPKAPETPKASDPKAPDPKAPEAPKAPDSKPPEPPKK